ncbi:MAG: HEPN domain-containing protein [Candidatus Bathyarchaeia archaeon]
MINIEVWDHSVSRKLENFPENLKPQAEIIDMAKELDRYYIPSRFSSFRPEGAPLDYYTKIDAERAKRYTGKIIGFLRSKILQTQLWSNNQRTQEIRQKALEKGALSVILVGSRRAMKDKG